MSEFIAESMWPDAPIERSIFGTDDPQAIWGQVLELCPEAVGCFAFAVSVGALLGLRLRDGSRVALKVHVKHRAERLEAVQRIQAHLFEGGFPCPRPLGVRGRATLEEWRDDGAYLDGHEPAVRRVVATQLAELVRRTDELDDPGMEPYLPPPGGPLWPTPHNVLFDFEATSPGAEWIDEIAAAAKPVRDTRVGRLVVGHGDWTVKHFRFEGLRPTVIYDWDSLNADFETVFVGNAAASFTYTEHRRVGLWPTVDEARAFLDEYENACDRPFTPEERVAAEAAAVYSRGYSTRCTHAVGKDTSRMGLRDYAEAFLYRIEAASRRASALVIGPSIRSVTLPYAHTSTFPATRTCFSRSRPCESKYMTTWGAPWIHMPLWSLTMTGSRRVCGETTFFVKPRLLRASVSTTRGAM